MAPVARCSLGTPIPEGVPPPAGDPVPEIDTHATGRPADQLHEWAAERAPALGIPVTALEAYAYAAQVAEVENPECHLAWTTLAGIGMVESHHGTYRGATIAPNGDVHAADPWCAAGRDQRATSRSSTPTAASWTAIRRYDRAMGPMQFIPETWRLYGVDANNDGVDQPRQHRRRGAVGGGLSVLAGQGPGDAARAG